MAENMRIRRTIATDLEPLNRLFAESYPVFLAADYAPEVLDRALPLIARANPVLLESGSYYLVERQKGGTPLAAGGWTAQSPHQPEPAGTGHVRHLVTHPQAARQGLAAAIMRHSFEEARAAGLTHLVALSTLTAVPFYAAMGFAAERAEIVAMAPEVSFPAVRMARTL